MPLHPTNSLLRIVVYAESPGQWCAQALECDVKSSSRTADAALDTLIQVFEAHMAADLRPGGHPLASFSPAPQPMWSKFAVAAQAAHPFELHRPDSPGRLRYLVAKSIDDAGASSIVS
jgi:hypothetical protein